MVGYACIAGVVFVLWGAAGFLVPGIDYPHPTLAQQVPVLVAATTTVGPRVGRVETDERTRLTVSAGPRSGAGAGREVRAGEGGAGGDEAGGCAREHDPAAVVAGAGAKVDDPVGVRHHRLMVLDDVRRRLKTYRRE
jgi:hypothetical protein